MNMWQVLIFFIFNQQLSMAGSTENVGYRFKVYPVNRCPTDKTAFETAAEKLNCSGRYMCAPNKDLTSLVEYCSDRQRSLYVSGNCLRLEGTGDLNHYNCSNFNTGCPKEHYSDDELYKYPACLNINIAFQCYISEKGCPVRNINRRTESNESTFNNDPVLITISVVFIFIVVIAAFLYLRRRRVQKETVENTADKYKVTQFLKDGHFSFCHARCILVGCAEAGKTTLLRRLEGANLKELKKNKKNSHTQLDIHVRDFEVVEEQNQKTIKRVKGSNIDMNQTITFTETEMDAEKIERPSIKNDEHIGSTYNENADERQRTINSEEIQPHDARETAKFSLEISEEEKHNTYEMRLLSRAEYAPEDHRKKQNVTSDFESVRLHEENIALENYLDDLSFLTKKQKNSRITLLNFAREKMYYAFHQIYLSPKAVYILVLDMTKGFDEKKTKFPHNILTQFETWTYKDYYSFWLKSIDSFSDITTPVIVVGTHAEKLSAEVRNSFFKDFLKLFADQEDLLRHIKLERCFSIGLPKKGSTLENLHEIKKCLADIVQSLPYWKENIKTKWAIFEYFLKKKQKKKIASREDLSMYNVTFDSDFKLAEEEITEVLKYLNRVGSILYNDDDNEIRNTVVIDVQWFVYAFKCLIDFTDKETLTDRKHFHETGELEDHELDAIWGKKDKAYLNHKKEIISYMEHLGMLAVCQSKTSRSKHTDSVWYYFPSLNRKAFDREHDTPKAFTPSSILCFQFDEKGQLPIFVFYALVSKCNQMEGWEILVEDKKKCIYEKTACFSYGDTIVIICICDFQIQVQVFFPPDFNEKSDKGRIQTEIQMSLEKDIRAFNRYSYEIGYKCQKSKFFGKNDNSFIPLEDFPTNRLLCSGCTVSEKHLVDNAICWIKRSGPEYVDTQLVFENSQEKTDEGMASLKHIFHDSLIGRIENIKFHLKEEIGSRKSLLKIVTVNGWNLLHCAAKGGNSEIFEIVKKETNSFQMINEKTYDQMTVLHIASKYGRRNICKIILKSEEFKHLNETSIQGKNACHFAAEGGFIEVLELLTEKGANAKEITKTGQNILHLACIYNQLEMCQYISEKYHDLLFAESTDRWNAILHAAKTGNKNILNFLWERKVSFDHESESKRNALHIACDHGNFRACIFIVDVCPALLDAVDYKGRHAGHFAVRSGNMKILKYLETKIDVTKDTRNGMNILHMACLHCQFEMCKYILKKYSYLNDEKTERGWTTAHFVAERGNKTGHEREIFEALLSGDQKVDINMLSNNRNSVLTLAIKHNDYEFTEYLLQFHSELLNIPNVIDPRKIADDDVKMKSILDRFLP